MRSGEKELSGVRLLIGCIIRPNEAEGLQYGGFGALGPMIGNLYSICSCLVSALLL